MTADAGTVPLIRVSGVSKSFAGGRGDAVRALEKIDLEVGEGEFMAIVGRSGCGKSTLLRIVAGLIPATGGSVTIGGSEVRGPRRDVGLMFQRPALLPWRSVLENVLAPTLAAPADEASAPDDERRARQMLEQVGLKDRLDHRPGELSGGEKQRAAVARALIRDPVLLLCDEPTGNLDSASADAVAELLLDLHARRPTILIVVTHSAALAARFPLRYTMDAGTLRRLPGSVA